MASFMRYENKSQNRRRWALPSTFRLIKFQSDIWHNEFHTFVLGCWCTERIKAMRFVSNLHESAAAGRLWLCSHTATSSCIKRRVHLNNFCFQVFLYSFGRWEQRAWHFILLTNLETTIPVRTEYVNAIVLQTHLLCSIYRPHARAHTAITLHWPL